MDPYRQVNTQTRLQPLKPDMSQIQHAHQHRDKQNKTAQPHQRPDITFIHKGKDNADNEEEQTEESGEITPIPPSLMLVPWGNAKTQVSGFRFQVSNGGAASAKGYGEPGREGLKVG